MEGSGCILAAMSQCHSVLKAPNTMSFPWSESLITKAREFLEAGIHGPLLDPQTQCNNAAGTA